MNMLKTSIWKAGVAKMAAAAMLAASCFVLPFGASAHPLGEGNCWPHYHTWRNAQDATAAARQELADAQASLNEALASGNIFSIIGWLATVAILTSNVTAAVAEEERLHQLFLDCDHF